MKMGVEIIPGVLLICTFVLLLTKGPGEAASTPAQPMRALRSCLGWVRSSPSS